VCSSDLATFVDALLAKARQGQGQPPVRFTNEVVQQLLAHQEELLGALLSRPLTTQRVGHFVVPDRPAPFVRCWADGAEPKSLRYTENTISCGMEDSVFVKRDLHLETVQFEHTVLGSQGMRAYPFAKLLGDRYDAERSTCSCTREHVTAFTCAQDFVETGGVTLRAGLCGRRYKGLPGLYDVDLRFVSVNSSQEGLIGSLTLSGVNYDLGVQVARRFLESVGWKP
jgi:serine protease Do